jgi:hypothetical protein
MNGLLETPYEGTRDQPFLVNNFVAVMKVHQ